MSNNMTGFIVVKEQTFDADDLQNIVVSMVFESVELSVTDCRKIKVIQYSEEELEEEWKFKSSCDGCSLEITSAYKTAVYMDIAPKQKYTIELPKAFTGNLTIKGVSGEIKLIGDAEWQKLTLSNAADIIQQGQIKVDVLSIKNTSGGIKTDNIESKHYEINTVGQPVSAKSLSGTGTIVSVTGAIKMGSLVGGEHTLSNKSGEIKIDDYEGNGALKSVSGSFQITIRKLTGNLSMNTTNGNIYTAFGESTSAQIEVSSLSGSIKSDLPNVKVSGGTVNTGFSTVNIGVNKKAVGTIGENPKWTVKIKTTTGSVHLK